MEKSFKLNGLAAIVVIVVVLGVAGLRLTSIGSNNDPALEKAVRNELMIEAHGSMVNNLKNMLRNNAIEMDAIKRPVQILKLGTSEPLFGVSSSKKAIVHVRYILPGEDEPKERYMKYEYGFVGNKWRYRYNSSALSYYLNIL